MLKYNKPYYSIMSKKEIVVIRHAIDDIMGCYESNMYRTPDLAKYYVDEKDRNMPINQNLRDEMRNIIKSRTDNIDPNDSSLMSYIREYLNRVCATNVDKIINDLKVLNYSSRKHFELLADELILKAINDVMGYKGMESNDLNTSEICVKIARDFYPFYLQDDEVSFGSVLAQQCSKCFKGFTEVLNPNNTSNATNTSTVNNTSTAYMNKFNPQRINNYKGLTNFIGLLYVAELFHPKIIMSCLQMIKRLVVQSNLSQEECDNYYAGYNRLITHIISRFEVADPNTVELLPHMVEEFFTIIDQIDTFNKEILALSLQNSNTDSRDDRNNSIRKYSISFHKLNMGKLSDIRAKYEILQSRISNSNFDEEQSDESQSDESNE